jgi:hypothetical protein
MVLFSSFPLSIRFLFALGRAVLGVGALGREYLATGLTNMLLQSVTTTIEFLLTAD